MIIIDTGPLVALFDPKDADHKACHSILETIASPLFSTESVLRYKKGYRHYPMDLIGRDTIHS